MARKLIVINKKILGEIESLEKSDQVYNISDVGMGNSGMGYDISSNKIMIKVENNYGLIGHELKHAFQYENGDISIPTNNTSYGQYMTSLMKQKDKQGKIFEVW